MLDFSIYSTQKTIETECKIALIRFHLQYFATDMKRTILLFFLAHSILLSSQTVSTKTDSLLAKMSLTEKIGQLFMIPVSTYASVEEINALGQFIKKYKPGSLYITKGGPKSHIKLMNRFQQASTIPLLVGLNAEWGLAQTLDSTFQFPMPIIVGANANVELMSKLGFQIGLQMRAIGAHINFAPNADIDVPLESMAIARYMGTNKIRVAENSIAFADGLKRAGVMAVAKHLPGLSAGMGDSNDPFVSVGPDTVSFYPYKKLIEHNIGGLLTSYMHFSTREKNKTVPAPLSQLFISDIIKKQTGFNGLAFSDVAYLKTMVRKKSGEAERTAFQVGNDVLIAPQDIRKAISKISKLVRRDKAMMAQLNASAKKILEAKFSAGLFTKKIIEGSNLNEKLFSTEAYQIDYQLKEGAITLLKNSNGLFPLKDIGNKQFNLVMVGNPTPSFEKSLNRYVPFNSIQLKSIGDTTRVGREFANSISIIALVGNVKDYSAWVQKNANQHRVLVCHFGNPTDLKYLAGAPVLLEGYDEMLTGDAMAQAIFGGISTRGSLPVSIDENFIEGTSIKSASLHRLAYTIPEEARMNRFQLQKIDSIVNEAMSIGATPGARVMVARGGKVVYDKSFGWQSSDRDIPVTEKTIYDLASVTKITATLQAVMYLYEQGWIDINKKISVYLPEFKKTNKRDFIIKDILTHQSGLWPYFPWHVDIVKDSLLMKQYFQEKYSSEYPFQVSKNMFSHRSMRDSMWNWIVHSKIIEKKDRTPYEYRYSDLGLYIMQRLIEKFLHQPLEDFVAQNFYIPIGATTMGFLPLKKFSEDRIAPTENDVQFRKSLLVGHVHDPGAAMHGGVAGHAGLFSNASDLLKMGQMWLQKGYYGGTQYFKPETIERFTAKQFATSRRGLGWDKPTGDWTGSTGVNCSPATFGHTGFTGPCIWVDPAFELVYVFLSNRVNPEINPKLLSANIRTRIQDVIYESIFEFSATH